MFERILHYVERSAFVGFCLIATNILCTEGISQLIDAGIHVFRKLPGVDTFIDAVLNSEVHGAIKLLTASGSAAEKSQSVLIPIPPEGVSANDVLDIVHSLHVNETSAEDGKAFAYTYTTASDMQQLTLALKDSYALFAEDSGSGVSTHETMLNKVWEKFMHTNALNPMMYPSLRKFETEIISMTAWMVNGDEHTVGSLTSGGTESILMAVKTYRDHARKHSPHIKRPNMIVSETIHPAFEKAAHYFGVEIIHVKTTPDFRVDIDAVSHAINKNTILLVGSAPQYCHGVVDPIEKLAILAQRYNLGLHVDACFGGFMLPWLEKLGQSVPLWDFRVCGVTSISADVHKYGYSSKGASVVLYKDAALRSFQYFAYAKWPGGLFGSPSMAGSRPGGMIAAAWAAIVSMGQNGYTDMAARVLTSTQKIIAGVEKIDGLRLATQPDMTGLAIVSDDPKINILAVADVLERIGGWKIERQQLPDSLHFSVLPQHSAVVPKLLEDLQKAVEEVRANPALAKQGTTGVYGMVAACPTSFVDDFIIKFFGTLYTVDKCGSIIESYYKSRQAPTVGK